MTHYTKMTKNEKPIQYTNVSEIAQIDAFKTGSQPLYIIESRKKELIKGKQHRFVPSLFHSVIKV